MTGGVSENPPPVSTWLIFRLGCAQLQQKSFRLIEVVDREVEVELFRYGLVGPTRSLIVNHPLEADEEPVVATEAGEVTVGHGVSLEPGCLPIERGKRLGISAVESDRGQLHTRGHGVTP